MLKIGEFTEGELWLELRQQRLQLIEERKELIGKIADDAARVQRIDVPGFTPGDQSRLNRKRSELKAEIRKGEIEVQKIDERLAALDAGEDILEGGLQ